MPFRFASFAALFMLFGGLEAARADDAAKLAFFESKIRPVLVEQCQNCHGPKKQQSSLRTDSRDALLKGGDNGPAVVVGKPEASLLVRVLKYDHDIKMPPKNKMNDPIIKDVESWIREGALWPAEKAKLASGPMSPNEARAKHWAFLPVKKTDPAPITLPVTAQRTEALQKAWNASPIDRFVLERMTKQGLSPSPEANRRTLLRRASFDLTGLPPTMEEVTAFEADTSLNAWEKQLDRLLASGHYGERWGRHWLDLARYADTKGYVFQEERRYPFSWTYRDYVISSLNADKPYDRFLKEQIAADLMDLGSDKKSLAALGYLTLGRRFLNNIHDIIDDRIDTVMRGLQGMTLACARCHDHKFDALLQKDYYALYGVFSCSTEPGELPLIGPPKNVEAFKAYEKGIAEREAKLEAFLVKKRKEVPERARQEAAKYLVAAKDNAQRGGRSFPALLAFTPQRQVTERWRQYLAKPGLEQDPVWMPWFTFAKLKPEELADRGGDILCELANQPPERVHPGILAGLLGGPGPKTLYEVSEGYGRAFERAIAAKPDDTSLMAIRKVLFDKDSPTDLPGDKIDQFFNRADNNELRGLKSTIDKYRATSPGSPPRAHVLTETPKDNKHRVFLRGNPGIPGPEIQRHFPEALSAPDAKPFEKGGGRLELAEALANPKNPLTARVWVNRAWMIHFGDALVRTPGDFGVRGEAPTHPELLDWLAATFVEDGWSMKKAHKRMMMSMAWRQSAEVTPMAANADPENRWLSHANRRRIEFEAQRDALISAGGQLQEGHEGASVELLILPWSTKRSIYGFIDRQNLPGLYRTFDLASPDVATPRRHNTTVPQQALFWMNHPLTLEMAQKVVRRAEILPQADPAAKVIALYRILFARNPSAEELADGLAFVGDFLSNGPPQPVYLGAWEQYAQALLCSNEFVFVD